MRELILLEILAVPAERSRGRHNPRVVKRKMSGFPTKARAAPSPRQVFRYEDHVRVVAPVGTPVDPAPPPPAPSKAKPKRRQPGETSASTGPAVTHPGSSMSVLGEPAACREPPSANATTSIHAPSTTGWPARDRPSKRQTHERETA